MKTGTRFSILVHPFLVLAILTASTLSTSVDEELKCLDQKPTDQCDIELSYGERLIGCDALVPATLMGELQHQPTLTLEPDATIDTTTPVLILMFDIDLPGPDESVGFMHWVAKAKINSDGRVLDIEDNPGQEYYPPSPPAGQQHRYQLFIFPFDADKSIAEPPKGSTRRDRLCDFIKRNDLAQPMAATQFQYASP